MADLSRRDFLKRATVALTVAGASSGGALANAASPERSAEKKQVATLIDLTKCDGCPDREAPACVVACREENSDRFPKPIEDIPNYWPQTRKEDWSSRRHITDRLTPYNWLAVQKVSVDGETVSIPRRCMHCDNPPCVRLCPVGATAKTPEGPVVINENLCLGGAKCRDVCPWHIRQRQAGVGVYLKIAPDYVGGGVMYACDLCQERLKAGKEPACVEACPRGAMEIGEKEAMRREAYARAEKIGGYVYGDKEAGGTSTFYVSAVPFDKIDAALAEQKQAPGMKPGVGTVLDSLNGLAAAALLAPVAGAVAAGFNAYRKLHGDVGSPSKKTPATDPSSSEEDK